MKKRHKISPDAELAGEGVEDQGTIRTEPSSIKETAASIAVKLNGFIRKKRKMLVSMVLPAVYCLIFGRTELGIGIYPFGIAAVCGSASGRSALIAAAGTAISSLFVRGGIYIAAAAALTAGFLLLAKRILGKDTVAVRAILATIMGAAQTFAIAIPRGIGFREICAVFLGAAVCPALALALRGVFSSEGDSPFAEWGIYAIYYTFLHFLRTLSPAGESAATVIAFLGIFFGAYSFGTHKAVMIGIAAGLAAAPEYSFVYPAAAVVAGILGGVSPMAAVLGASVVALAFGLYSAGAFAFGDLFPELMLASAIAAPVTHYRIIPKFLRRDKELRSAAGDGTAELRLEAMKKRLSALSHSLGAVSAMMKKISDAAKKPSFSEMRQLCDDAFDESCQLCVSRDKCWDREYRATASAVSAMASTLRKGVRVDEGHMPEGMRLRCRHKDEILSRIALAGEAPAAGSLATDGLARGYRIASGMIGEVAEGDTDDLQPDRDAAEALSQRFRDIGLTGEVLVLGKRRRRVSLRGIIGCTVGNEEIRCAAESVLGCRMSSPEYSIDGSRVHMTMHAAERFTVEMGRCSLAKKGERSGDSITSFSGDGGYFFALISDGMGSGSEASLASGTGVVLLRRMLTAGASLTSSLEMLNSFLSERREECFTTVDLMEADLITGELRFIKSGAAPSFVLRDGRLFRLTSRTVPIGVITPYDAEQIKFLAKEGDFVIMLSDGVVPDGEECPWLYEMLCDSDGDLCLSAGVDLTAAAKMIANRAAKEYGHSDDITVGILYIGGDAPDRQTSVELAEK